MVITPKSARKHQRRQEEQFASMQMAKVRFHIGEYMEPNETLAMAVKRLLTERNYLLVELTDLKRKGQSAGA